MTRTLRLVSALLVLILLPLGAQSQMSMRWNKRFNMPGWIMYPTDVAIDAVGNVYTAAERHQGGPSSVVVSKFSPTGVFLWSRFFEVMRTSNPRIEVTRDGKVFVSHILEVSKTYVAVTRLSTENGAVLWQKYLDGLTNADLLVRDQDGQPVQLVSLFYTHAAVPSRMRAEILDENGQVVGKHVYYPPVASWGGWEPTGGILYGDQFAYVVGKQLNDAGLSPCRLIRVGMNGVIRSVTELSYTSQIAYSPVAGGRILTAGASGQTSLRLNLVHALTGQLLDSNTDFFPTSFSISVRDAEADASGSLYVVGEDNTNGSVSDPLCVRYSFPGLSRLWAASGIAETQEVRFEHASLDPFGTLFAVSLGTTSGARVYGIDTGTGRSMGVASSSALPGSTSFFNSLAVNGLGMAGHAIGEHVTLDRQLAVQLVRPVGLLNVTLPVTELAAGTSTTGTLRVYLPIASTRSINLSSNSTYIQVPSSRTLTSGQATVTFPITSTLPPSDRFVTIVADDGRSRRSAKFLLKRP